MLSHKNISKPIERFPDRNTDVKEADENKASSVALSRPVLSVYSSHIMIIEDGPSDFYQRSSEISYSVGGAKKDITKEFNLHAGRSDNGSLYGQREEVDDENP
jgi:hypothetical protein